MKISVAPLLKRPYGASEQYDLGEASIDQRSEHAGLLDAPARSIAGSLLFTHTNLGVYVAGELSASVELECGRCLDRFSASLPVRVSEQYYTTIHVQTGAPLAAPPRDAYVIGHDFIIDVTPLLREQILLELPLKPLCRESCAGICPSCGLDQNEHPHRHAEADERWSRLRQLLADFQPEDRTERG